MSKETTYHAIVLKKQPFGEADEIITFYTKEAGKIRGLAKSIKQPKSKLQSVLQSLFFIKFTLAGSRRSGLRKIIRAEVLKTFPQIRNHLVAAKSSFFALEAILKGTADEHKNEKLFSLLEDFLSFCNQHHLRLKVLNLGLAKFKITLLEHLGLAIHYPRTVAVLKTLFFSNGQGGFILRKNSQDSISIDKSIFGQFLKIKGRSFDQLATLSIGNIKKLQNLLSQFLMYQLEREIITEKYLNQEV